MSMVMMIKMMMMVGHDMPKTLVSVVVVVVVVVVTVEFVEVVVKTMTLPPMTITWNANSSQTGGICPTIAIPVFTSQQTLTA